MHRMNNMKMKIFVCFLCENYVTLCYMGVQNKYEKNEFLITLLYERITDYNINVALTNLITGLC